MLLIKTCYKQDGNFDFIGLVFWALSLLQTVVLKQVMPEIEVFGFRRLHTEGGSTHKQTSNPVQFGARLLIFVA